MKKSKIAKIGAVGITILFIASVLALPMSGATDITKNVAGLPLYEDEGEPVLLDTIYTPEEEDLFVGDQNDIGYNTDAGKAIFKSFPVYVGEPVDQSIPGRGRTGTLEPDGGDSDDWYKFSACEGQSVQASVNSGEDYDYEFHNYEGDPVGQSFTADATDVYFLHIFSNEGAGTADYTFSVILGGQDDAGKGSDAGNNIGSATSITPGSYGGYMSYTDQEDWYSFTANSGQGIFVTVEPIEKSDYDIHLYNPSGELVYSAQYYGDDELEYPADTSGTWKIKLDMFPGWDESKWPDNYFLYGSGAYILELSIGGSAQAPPGPIPQPDITPVAQTFIV
ncbi:MAG: hypothetical protein KAR64_01440, partial [Thermoplasmatales archaeon]|nr:hypothetical protein [Thermoplasmatales archaeon]